DVGDRRVAAQDLLDLVRVDVAATADDEVLGAPEDLQEAVGVEPAEVAHVDPAVLPVGPVVLAPVPLLDGVAAHADLPFRGDHRLAAVVRPADGMVALLARVAGAPDAELAGVHRAVEDADPGAG